MVNRLYTWCSKHIIELCKTISQFVALKLHNYNFNYGTVAGYGARILSAC